MCITFTCLYSLSYTITERPGSFPATVSDLPKWNMSFIVSCEDRTIKKNLQECMRDSERGKSQKKTHTHTGKTSKKKAETKTMEDFINKGRNSFPSKEKMFEVWLYWEPIKGGKMPITAYPTWWAWMWFTVYPSAVGWAAGEACRHLFMWEQQVELGYLRSPEKRSPPSTDKIDRSKG